tara:strand:- start:1855 stop:3039 length:1185 start_codon:yes stop_codon:yes gene_type:complete
LGFYIFFSQKKKLNISLDILIFILPYVLIALSLFYSINKEYGLELLIKMLSFLIFPIIFYINIDFFSQKNIYKVLDFFSFSVLILIIFQAIQVLVNFDFISSTITLQEIKSNGYFSTNEITEDKIDQIKLRRFRNFIIKISNTHTTYQGLWISLATFYLGLKSFASEKKIIKIISLIVISIFTLWLYLISARMPFLALVFSSILIILIFSKFSLKKKALVLLIPFFVLVALMSFKNPFSIRVKEYYNTGFSVLGGNSRVSEFNSSNVRNGVYYCDIKLIKEAPFFGFGIGSVQDKLNECYQDYINSKVYKWNIYNTHNQYAFFWIASGVLGLISFLSLIFISFFNSFKKKNILLFYLTSITAMVFFTENLLQRSDGVIFYSFFVCLFFFNKLKK